MRQLRQIIFVIGLGLMCTSLVSAQTPTVSTPSATVLPTHSTSPRPTRQQRENNQLEKLKERANREIDRRIEKLKALIEKITAMKRLTAEEKKKLTDEVLGEITKLQNLKTKINNDTDMATLIADIRSIVQAYKEYRVFMPKIEIVAQADRLQDVVEDLSKLADSLKQKATQPQMQTLLTSMQNHITNAQTKIKQARDIALNITPRIYPGSNSEFNKARDLLRDARKEAHAALEDAHQLKKMLGDTVTEAPKQKDATPSGTITLTPQTTMTPGPSISITQLPTQAQRGRRDKK